jgi:hypothetical protein
MNGFLGQGILANWGGVTDAAETDYNAWHSLEHMPERMSVPGFRRGRRCIAVEGTPAHRRYFMMYETESVETLGSAPYLARLNDPTPWTRRILSEYIAPSRTICRVLRSSGRGVGGWIATFEFGEDTRAAAVAFAGGDWLEGILAEDGVLAAHAIEGDPVLGQQPTAEKAFREARDKDVTVAVALMIEGMDHASTEAAMTSLTERLGVLTPDCVTLYVTQHVLSDVDVRP